MKTMFVQVLLNMELDEQVTCFDFLYVESS